jgi:hypothetical protein
VVWRAHFTGGLCGPLPVAGGQLANDFDGRRRTPMIQLFTGRGVRFAKTPQIACTRKVAVVRVAPIIRVWSSRS